ncbi:cell division protein FtsQ/DivIB [Marinobacter caseinilyticus]|uniref:cell division protein FtsQ/DivIB n=1 Tax=Marinobacter caseinilyticus TaxID=2692195 RepID=UPI001407D628|nr:cell division protein FtsQ/DivIB [Marinobacter caseinilyticus]
MLDLMHVRSRSIPPDPPRRRGATSDGPQRNILGPLKALLAAIPWQQTGLGALVLVVAGLVPWGAGEVLTALDRQITTVKVVGTLVGENQAALESRAGQWIGRSFFATDLAEVKAALEQRPWVETAAIRRVWPDGLMIEIREKKPLAYWNDDQLISRSGVLFTPPNREVAGPLPRLSGPDDRLPDVIATARMMVDTLTAQGLGFAGLALEKRGAWTLRLANGIDVVLGRDQVEQRFERFMTVYESQLAARADEVKRIDARYTNGVAVQWKPLDKASGKNT